MKKLIALRAVRHMAKSGMNPKTLQYLMGISDKDDKPLKQNMFKVI
ncbi:MAG: hypothetical protein ACLUOO_04280 [Coprococcus sp.]